MAEPHILIVTFPGQGHINPGIQLAKRLVSLGVKVTFALTVGAHRRMARTNVPIGFSFATFSDGYDDGYNLSDDFGHYVYQLTSRGSQTFPQIITEAANKGHPLTCIIYSLLLPWVPKVARQFRLPTIFLWNQPATVFDIYYYYHHGYADEIHRLVRGSSFSLDLPGLPTLRRCDLPSFLFPKHAELHSYVLPKLKEDFEVLDEQTNPVVLVNTFDELESSALNSVSKYKLIGIGPLMPSAFLGGKDSSDKSFGVDLNLFQGSKDYIQWLDTKPHSSVIYVSFGSISALSEAQMEEVVKALIDIDRPFLLVTRGKVSKRELIEEKGMIVPWCNQVEVLSHGSVGCFMTHCGWNSTMEGLVSGAPMVALPQWSDQTTNAKMIEHVWKTGVRVVPNFDDIEGICKSEEIKRCLNMVMGGSDRATEMINNAKKWKHSARVAVHENGSSDNNLKQFLCETREGYVNN